MLHPTENMHITTACSPHLLRAATPLMPEEVRPLTADETRARPARCVSRCFNQSSLTGAGAIVKEEVCFHFVSPAQI